MATALLHTHDLASSTAQQSAVTPAHDRTGVHRDRTRVQAAIGNSPPARGNVAAAELKLELDEIALSYTALTAPFNGATSVREAEPGQLAGPSVAIFTLDALNHSWPCFYVSEQDLGKMRLGKAFDVTNDLYSGKICHRHSTFISPDPKRILKTVETHTEWMTLVYRSRIDVDNPAQEWLYGAIP